MKLAKVVIDTYTSKFDRYLVYAIYDGMPDFDESTVVPASNYSKIVNTYNNLLSKIDTEKLQIGKYPICVGTCVCVPYNNTIKTGYVIEILDDCKIEVEFDIDKLKPLICAVSISYFNSQNVEFAKFISNYYVCNLYTAIKLFVPSGINFKCAYSKKGFYIKSNLPQKYDEILNEGEYIKNNQDNIITLNKENNIELTQEQKTALNEIDSFYSKNESGVVLLDGVTSSGKTEVYMRAISKALKDNKTAIVLVPEISLSYFILDRLKRRFGDLVACVNSQMTVKERYLELLKINNGIKKIVCGPRSSLFTQIKNIGIIVVDEQHDASYKQNQTPRYDAIFCSEWLANVHKAILILSSATPSIESLYNCKFKKNWKRVVMPHRVKQAKMPKIDICDMSNEFQSGMKSIFSNILKKSIIKTLKENNKVILLNSRRGYSNYVFCRNCGFVPRCPKCSVALTYHETKSDSNKNKKFNISNVNSNLVCHHCGHKQKTYVRCPKCSSPYIAKLGAGTQNVEQQLDYLISSSFDKKVPVYRLDGDTSIDIDKTKEIINDFKKPGPGVLIGTQLIAKGLDFEDVSLVGVVLIDSVLNFPDFRSNERCFNLLSQVAGRAGRGNVEGRVIIQTYCPDSPVIKYAAKQDRTNFLKHELPRRKILQLPPYFRLANIIVRSKDKSLAQQTCEKLQESFVFYRRNKTGDNWYISASMPCDIKKLRNYYRYHIILKANYMFDLSLYIRSVIEGFKKPNNVIITTDVDPQHLY